MNRRLLILLMVAMLALAGLAQAGTRYNVPVTELSVTLTDENQVPLEFVLLKLMFPEAPNAVATASTNKNGVAVFKNLKLAISGKYYFFAQLAPFVPNQQGFSHGIDTIYISGLKDVDVTKKNSIALIFDSAKYVTVWKTTATYFNYFYIRSAAKPSYFVKFDVDKAASLLYVHAPMNKMYQLITSDSDNMISEQMIWWDYYAVPGLVVTI